MIIVRPDRRVLTIWRILLIIFSIIPALAITFFLKGFILTIAAVLWFAVFLFFYLIYMPILYKSLLYTVTDTVVSLRRGVFMLTMQHLPIPNVQFTALTTSPFSRIFGLVSLNIVAPGGRVSMPGLSMKEARAFANRIAQLEEEANGEQD